MDKKEVTASELVIPKLEPTVKYGDVNGDGKITLLDLIAMRKYLATAMLVYDMFGGSIHRIRVDGGGTHYFNKVNGHYIDLTVEQFDLYNIPVSYEPNEQMDRKYCGKNIDTQKRFELLVKRIADYLATKEN